MPLPMRCITLFLLMLFSGMSIFSVSQANVESDRQAALREREEMRKRLSELQKKLAQNATEQSAVQKKIRTVDLQIAELTRDLQQSSALLGSAEKKQQTLDLEKKSLDIELQAQQEKLADIVRRQYRSGTGSHWRTLLSGSDIQTLHQTLHYSGYVAQKQRQQVEVVENSLQRLASLQERQREQQQIIQTQIDRQTTLQQSLIAAKKSQEEALEELEVSRQKDAEQAMSAQQNEQQLSLLVEQLQTVLKKAQQDELIRPAVVTIEGTPPQSSVKWADIRGKNFPQLKGRLLPPTPGKIADVFGRKKSGGDAWQGVFIQSQEGAPVLAMADGTIAFADWYSGFGHLVIIDHGGGYLSLYGYNQTLLKSVGDTVQAGEKIALVGRSGGQKLAALYLEIRSNGQPINPLLWIKT